MTATSLADRVRVHLILLRSHLIPPTREIHDRLAAAGQTRTAARMKGAIDSIALRIADPHLAMLPELIDEHGTEPDDILRSAGYDAVSSSSSQGGPVLRAVLVRAGFDPSDDDRDDDGQEPDRRRRPRIADQTPVALSHAADAVIGAATRLAEACRRVDELDGDVLLDLVIGANDFLWVARDHAYRVAVPESTIPGRRDQMQRCRACTTAERKPGRQWMCEACYKAWQREGSPRLEDGRPNLAIVRARRAAAEAKRVHAAEQARMKATASLRSKKGKKGKKRGRR